MVQTHKTGAGRTRSDAGVDIDALAPFAAKLAGVGYWHLDMVAQRFVWSDEMYRIYGLDPSVGPPDVERLVELCHPDDRERLLAHQKAMAGRDAEIRVRILRPDGLVRHVISRSTARCDADDRPVARIGTLLDVTELQRAEATARESEQRYRFLTENVPDMIVRVSLGAAIRDVSPGSAKVFGYTPEEMLRVSPRDMTHPDDLPLVTGALQGLTASGQRSLSEPLRYRARRKDGEWIWVESNPTIIFNEAGEAIETIDIVRDVTRAQAVEAELKAARERAEAAAAAKSAFLANMSHELRTPLTSIIGFSRLLREREELTGDAQAFANRIAEASEALLAIINDVLDLSKLEAGHAALELQPLSVTRLAEETCGIVAIQAAAKGLELRLDLDPATPELITGDITRLRQVLLNLLSNALKFTDRGSVTVRTRWRSTRQGGRLKLSVVDTGAGIAREHQGRLFERFAQAEVSINRTHGGTGLGLAICKGIVQLMGGRIGVSSRPGRGSSFWFVIPADPAASAAPDEVDEPTDCPPLRMLLVDDTAVNRELVRLMLGPLGIELDEAAGGADAIKAAMSRAYDVILMDVRMPGVDGLEATRVIRVASPHNRTTPILALTADVQPENAAACREAGMNDVLAKPIVPRELLSKVVRWGSGPAPARPASRGAA